MEFCSGQPDNPAASVRDYCTGVLIFQISAKTQSSSKSAAISNTLAELYITDQITIKFQATENAVIWLTQRVSSLETELQTTEQEIAQLRSNSELVSLEAVEILNRQAKNVADRLAETKTAMGLAQVRLGDLIELKETGDTAAMSAAQNDSALNRLFGNLEAGGEQARQLFEVRFDFLISRARTNLDRTVEQINALERSAAQFQKRIESQSIALAELEQLSRNADATRVLYETFLTRLKETAVQRGLQQADSRILSIAPPGEYVEPRKSRILAVSFLLGCMIGAALVLLRQMLHTGFRTAEELESFSGLPVLGQVPLMPIRRRKGLIPYLKDKPTSAAAEAIRNLRTSVLLSDVDSPPQVIMSTSSIPGEGKTTQAISLTQNLSGLGKKVLLIEGDIRRRTFGEYFDFDQKGGILTALSGEATLSDCVRHDKRLSADVLMGEKSNVNAADVFSSDRFKDFLQEARQTYEYIVIDTPPVLVVPDARVIGQLVDAIIYSVAWDDSSKSQVSEGLQQFASVNLRVTGLVLTKIDAKGMKRYGYGGKYGAYSRYGSKYYEA